MGFCVNGRYHRNPPKASRLTFVSRELARHLVNAAQRTTANGGEKTRLVAVLGSDMEPACKNCTRNCATHHYWQRWTIRDDDRAKFSPRRDSCGTRNALDRCHRVLFWGSFWWLLAAFAVFLGCFWGFFSGS